ncbi:MAG TPA: hypothetical protein VG675_21265 [Bryobacteraceae bacterium]|nr:hypothetical protein [Bryobacteraceae bacterium]
MSWSGRTDLAAIDESHPSLWMCEEGLKLPNFQYTRSSAFVAVFQQAEPFIGALARVVASARKDAGSKVVYNAS